MTYTPKGSEGDGKRRTIYLPQGTAERATLLFVHEDWAALENEFEIYSKWSGLGAVVLLFVNTLSENPSQL